MVLGAADVWVGRERELAALRAAVEGLGRGDGSVVWVEGEAGIGKTALAAQAAGFAQTGGHDILTGIADPISRRAPLRVMLDLLQVGPRSEDPRRREIAAVLAERRPGGTGPDVEPLAGLVGELCAEAPRVLVVDDLQHLDDASFLLWHQLVAAADQLPLLLLTTVRALPRGQAVQDLRAAVERRGHRLLALEPLAPARRRTC